MKEFTVKAYQLKEKKPPTNTLVMRIPENRPDNFETFCYDHDKDRWILFYPGGSGSRTASENDYWYELPMIVSYYRTLPPYGLNRGS